MFGYGYRLCFNIQSHSCDVYFEFCFVFASDVFAVTEIFGGHVVYSDFRAFKVKDADTVVYINEVCDMPDIVMNGYVYLSSRIGRCAYGNVDIGAVGDYSVM